MGYVHIYNVCTYMYTPFVCGKCTYTQCVYIYVHMYIYIYLGPGLAGPVLQPGLPAAAAAAQPAAVPGRAGAAAGAAAAVAWQGASSVVNLVSSVAHGLCRQQVGGGQ